MLLKKQIVFSPLFAALFISKKNNAAWDLPHTWEETTRMRSPGGSGATAWLEVRSLTL